MPKVAGVGDWIGRADSAEDWVGYARQQALLGGPHPLWDEVARMNSREQDVIDRFLLERAAWPTDMGQRLIDRLQEEAFDELVNRGGGGAGFSQAMANCLLGIAREWSASGGNRRQSDA